MVIGNSVNDPGFLNKLAEQAAKKPAYAMDRAKNRALGLGRQMGQGPQMQVSNPYYLNPGRGAMSQVSTPGAWGAPAQPPGLLPPPQTPPGMLPAPVQPPGMLPAPTAPGAGFAPPVQPPGMLPAPTQPPGMLPGLKGLPAPTAPGSPAGWAPPNVPPASAWADDAAGLASKVAASPADELLVQAAGGIPSAGAGVANVAEAAAAGSRMPGFLQAANITKMGVMRGAGVAGVGYAVSGMLDNMNIGGEQSLVDKGGSSAIMGAGLGAGAAIALGLGTGPIGWAALGGAALFAGARMAWGGDKSSFTKAKDAATDMGATIQNLGQTYGLDSEAMADIMMQYDASTQLYIDQKDKDGLKTYLAGVSGTLPALMLQAKEEQQARVDEDKRYQGMLATQAQFAPIFQQSMNQAYTSSAGALATANEVSQRLEATAPNLAALVRNGAAVSNEAANRLYTGYAAQMAMGPRASYDANNLAGLQAQVEQTDLLNQYMQAAG